MRNTASWINICGWPISCWRRRLRRFRSKASAEQWVGGAPNLEKVQNRIWFTLRQGSHNCRSLQAAWSAHGPDNLSFEECERLEEEATPYIRDALLKERMRHWRTQLGAEAV